MTEIDYLKGSGRQAKPKVWFELLDLIDLTVAIDGVYYTVSAVKSHAKGKPVTVTLELTT